MSTRRKSEMDFGSVWRRDRFDQTDAVQGSIAVFHSITQIKQTELALRQAETRSREQAQQLQQTLTDRRQVQAQLIPTDEDVESRTSGGGGRPRDQQSGQFHLQQCQIFHPETDW